MATATAEGDTHEEELDVDAGSIEEDDADTLEPWSSDPPSEELLNHALQVLSEKKSEWVELPLEDKLDILKEIRNRLLSEPVTWAQVSAQIKGCESVESIVASELMSNVMLVANTVDGLIHTLKHLLKKKKCPQLQIQSLLSGQQKIQVFPLGFWENHLNFYSMQGLHIELYLQPGKSPTLCSTYTSPHEGQLCVVLGAGNQGYLALGDVLYQLFNKGCVVILKYHPLQALYATYAEYVLEPLRRRGYFWSMVSDDVELVQHALYSPLTDAVHLTGTRSTYELIMWGHTQEEQQQRKQQNDPLLKVPVTCQLDCVTPYIIVPGPWQEDDTDHHVKQLVAAFSDNNSCNSMTPRVVFVAGDWDVTDVIIAKFKELLADHPLLPAYYPGMHSRYNAFKRAYPQAEAISSEELPGAEEFGPTLPWLINIMEEYPQQPQEEHAFQVDSFCPVITFVKLWANEEEEDGNFEVDFLLDAVNKANEHLAGNQSVTVIVHNQTEDMYREQVESALQQLRYGVVCINAWSNVAYFPQVSVWGSYAEGEELVSSKTSGIGHVRNSFMYDHIQHAIVHTPFISSMHPMPFSVKKISVLAAKTALGLHTNGLLGMYKMFTQAR